VKIAQIEDGLDVNDSTLYEPCFSRQKDIEVRVAALRFPVMRGVVGLMFEVSFSLFALMRG